MRVPAAKLRQLRRFATAFEDARRRRVNESDTVMFLVKFLEEVLGYDSLAGQISKELAIRDRYCDIALKPDGEVRVLVEAKAASVVRLRDKHIEQAGNYAARAGIPWAVLTNGMEWRLYHLTFAEGEGIAHELAFSLDLSDDLARNPADVWAKLSLLAPRAITAGSLDDYWTTRKLTRPGAVVRALFTYDVLARIRQELNIGTTARLELQDVFDALRDVVSKDALMEAGELRLPRPAPRRTTRGARVAATARGERAARARGASSGAAEPATVRPHGSQSPTVGQEIVRSYKGRDVRVTVIEGGFEYERQSYPSLTAVARAVTGAASISGPGFFRLTARRPRSRPRAQQSDAQDS